MPKQFNRQSLKQQTLYLLTTAPDGMGSRELLHKIRPKISQPTLSRTLVELRADGGVHKLGEARATRYFATGGRLQQANIRSRLLHRKVAERLVRQPQLRALAIQRLAKLRKVNPSARVYHEQWARLLEGDLSLLLQALSEPGEPADQLRKESPFTTLLPKVVRQKLFAPRFH